MPDISPLIVAFLTTCTFLTGANLTVAQETAGRATLSNPVNPLPPQFLSGPAVESSSTATQVYRGAEAAPLAIPDTPIPADTWRQEYVRHFDAALYGSAWRSPSGNLGDWWCERLPYVEFVPIEPGQLKASAQHFIDEHTLPPEHDYDIDVFDQNPISVASSKTVTVVSAGPVNSEDAQDAENSAENRLRTDIRKIRPTLSYAMRNIERSELPEGFNEKLDQGDYVARQSSPAVLQWAPTNLYHYPLYFEDPSLERYGHTYHPVVQPFASAGRFATQLVGLPYQMTLRPVHSREYALGYYRPGECAPKKHYQIPFNEEAAIMQAAAMAGFFLIFP